MTDDMQHKIGQLAAFNRVQTMLDQIKVYAANIGAEGPIVVAQDRVAQMAREVLK